MFILFHLISTTTITITSCFIVAQPSLHCLHILVRTFFMFYTIVYIKNINEMQCNIYYVYIIPSDVITITTSCFIVATTFSPLPSSPMSLHPTVSFFLHLLWWFLFLLHQLRHQLFCKSYFLIRLLILLLNYSIGFTSCHSVPVCYV